MVELTDRHKPNINRYATAGLPDRHEAFLDTCSADFVGRQLERCVRCD